MSASNPRGLRAVCGLPVRLRKDGACGKHENIDVSGGRYDRPVWRVCGGTGEKPRRVLG